MEYRALFIDYTTLLICDCFRDLKSGNIRVNKVELAATLLDYFIRRIESNINRADSVCVTIVNARHACVVV